MSYTAGNVMDTAASLLNDTAKTLFSYDVQLPYLKIAQDELEQELILNEFQIDFISEAIILVSAGSLALSLPTSFFLPISLGERAVGGTLFVPMTEKANVLDPNVEYTPTDKLEIWDYRHNCINFVGSTVDREVRLSYWRTLTPIVGENSNEAVNGAKLFLSFRTGGLVARYIGRNKVRADELDLDAARSIDRLLAIFAKNRQGLRIRRRPFRLGGRLMLR